MKQLDPKQDIPALDPAQENLADLVAMRVQETLRGLRGSVIVPEYLSPLEASHFLSYPAKTLEFWRLNNKGPAFVRQGRHVRYRVQDLRAFMGEGRIEPNGGGK